MTISTPRPAKKPITFPDPAPRRAPGVRAVSLSLPRFSDDLRLFALTFAGGFLFTALFIA